MLSRQEEEQERRETLENDRLVLEAERRRILREGTTFHQFGQSQAHDEAGGRYASISPISVVGADPTLKYPAAAAHQADPVGIEPPLGYSVDQVEPIEPSTVIPVVVEAGAPAVEAPEPGVQATTPPTGAVETAAGVSLTRSEDANGA
jgi:hypothetical protein